MAVERAPVEQMKAEGRLPLEGVRVADLSWFGAGPICGQMLANFGAEVIRVESESHPDGLRTTQPVPPGKSGLNVSGYYNNFNASKLSFTLNLNHPKARDLALKLIARSDVVLENYTPRVMEKWGLTDEAIFAANPRVIVVHMPMQGTDGPHRDFLGFGGVLAPLTGFSYLSGFPHQKPVGVGTNYPDYVVNPGHAAIAILAALRWRRRTGKGQRIEVSQLESTVSALGPFVMDYLSNGRVAGPSGNRHPYAAPHGAYPCTGEDRWCVIAVFSDAEWDALCEAMGRPAWCLEERFATAVGRKGHEDELDGLIAEWTATKQAHELMELLQGRGVPAGVVQTAEDVLDHDEHLRQRGFYVYLDHPETGRAAYDGPHFRLHRTPGRLRSPAPLLGQHNEYVAREILGLTDEQMAEYVIEQVIH
jgi:crotonobetainyl-CoA:carnitine CoA-transferase CaiB-like acyl-CoA transferase